MSSISATALLTGSPEVATTRKPIKSAVASQGTAVSAHIKKGRPKTAKTEGQRVDNAFDRDSISAVFLSVKVRTEIEAQLFRLIGKRDPRSIPRTIHERTGVPEQAVDFVIQGLVREYRAWSREIRAALVRADEAGAATWKRTA